MKKLFTVLAIVCCLHVKAQTWVTIPDANFVTYLQSIIPAAMNGNQMNTSSTLVTTTTHIINVWNHSITNLFGVQYFSSLTSLGCGANSLTNLPTLPNSLTYLDCDNNLLTSLPTLPILLDSLVCDYNQLTSLPTLPNSLTYLVCAYNALIALPSLPNSLIYLICEGCSLTSLPALPNSLQYLSCKDNSLTSIPNFPNSLISIDCSGNSLVSLPTLPNSLKVLNCSGNNITCFPIFPNSIQNAYYSTIPFGHWEYFINLDPNPYNCLPNYLPNAMDTADLAKPLCAAGNTNGCAVATGINSILQNNTISIYPNPAQNNFTIETSSTDKQTLQMFDVNGKLVLSQTIKGTTNMDANNLSQGVYNLSLTTNEGVINKRLVIVK